RKITNPRHRDHKIVCSNPAYYREFPQRLRFHSTQRRRRTLSRKQASFRQRPPLCGLSKTIGRFPYILLRPARRDTHLHFPSRSPNNRNKRPCSDFGNKSHVPASR